MVISFFSSRVRVGTHLFAPLALALSVGAGCLLFPSGPYYCEQDDECDRAANETCDLVRKRCVAADEGEFCDDDRQCNTNAGEACDLESNRCVVPVDRPHSLTLLSGDGQRGSVNEVLEQAFQVRATDGQDQPAPDYSVSFVIHDMPLGAEGAQLSVTITETDPNGEASASLILGDLLGEYIVHATIEDPNVDPVVFTATAVCPTGFATCDGDSTDCDTDITTAMNCGACGTECAEANPVCSGAEGTYACSDSCGALILCGTSCVDTQTNAMHCGECDSECPVVDNGAPTCAGGECGFDCAALTLCGTSCVDTQTNAMHCGECDSECPVVDNGAPTCAGGECGFECAAGRGDCDGDALNGCEVNLTSNVGHCNECDNACPVADNATRRCTNSTCSFTCSYGWGNCDENPLNGCETPTVQDPENCGACDFRCPAPPANAVSVCNNSSCAFECIQDFANCNGSWADGCEADLRSNQDHCWQCNYACIAPATCINSACTCPAGTTPCGEPLNCCDNATQFCNTNQNFICSPN